MSVESKKTVKMLSKSEEKAELGELQGLISKSKSLTSGLAAVDFRNLKWTRKDVHLTVLMTLVTFGCAVEIYLPGVITHSASSELAVSQNQEGLLGIILYPCLALSFCTFPALMKIKMGRKGALLVSLYTSVIETVFCSLVPNYWTLVLSRALLGLCIGLNMSVAGVYFAEQVSSYDMYSVGNLLGLVAFTLGGGWVTVWGYLLLRTVGWRYFIVCTSVPVFLPPIFILHCVLTEQTTEDRVEDRVGQQRTYGELRPEKDTEDISKMKVVKDARIDVLSDIHRIGSINATVFSDGKVCEPLPKVYSGRLSVINEINERGQRKEAKNETLKELVTKHDTKSNKAAAMSELRGISESKTRKEAAMQEIKDRETTKDVKGQAMAELKKVADIKDKVGNVELPIGAAEKAIAVHSKAMKDISTIGKQKDTKSEALKEMMTISTAKDTKEKVVGEIGQIGQARSAKEAAHLELRTLSSAKENKENMQNELMNKTDGARQNLLTDIEARGKQADDEREKLSQFVAGHSENVKIAGAKMNILTDIESRGKEVEQGRQSVSDLFEGRANQMNVLSDIKDMGKEKEEGMKHVELLFAAKSSKTDLLSDIRQIKEEKDQGRANVEKLLGARGSKTGAMAEIRQIKEEKEKGIQKLEETLGNRPPSTSE